MQIKFLKGEYRTGASFCNKISPYRIMITKGTVHLASKNVEYPLPCRGVLQLILFSVKTQMESSYYQYLLQ